MLAPNVFLLFIPLLAPIQAAPSPAPSAGTVDPSRELVRSLEEAVVDATYRLTQEESSCAWEAANPAQAMRSTFTPLGVRIAGGDERPWYLGLRLMAWGRAGALQAVEAAEPNVAGRRVEYAHGTLTEWYVNGDQGLEQAFAVDAPPPDPLGEGPVVLAFALAGGLTAEVLPSGRDALFTGPSGGPIVHYTGLQAWDADGRELEASLATDGDRLLIRVEDQFARYPLYVDPWIKTEEAKFTASTPSPGDGFGASLGLSGDTAVVGAPGDDQAGTNAGAAYVFVRTGSTWTEQQKLLGNDTATNDQFGGSVAVQGDTVVVGASGNDDADTDTGSAYVFVRSGTTWTEEAQLAADDPEVGDFLGTAVALDGDTAVVGTRSAEGVAITPGGLALDPNSGRLFASAGSLLNEVDPQSGFASLIGSIGFASVRGLDYDPNADILYGADHASDQLITIDTSTGAGVAVGPFGFPRVTCLAFDPNTDTLYGVDVGADELLTIDTGTGAATAVGPIGFLGVQGLAFDANTDTLFATDISTDQLMTVDTVTGAGTAVGPLGFGAVRGLAFDETMNTLFGSDPTFDELLELDTALGAGSGVGPYRGQLTGSAYVFVRSGTLWTQEQKLIASDKAAGAKFGLQLAVSGDTALIGAEGDDQMGAGAGSAYAFVRTGTTWSEEQKLLASDGGTGDLFGSSVALVGDTAAVGATRDDLPGGFDQGSVYVFTRAGTTWSEDQKLVSSEAADQDLFGHSLALLSNTLLIGCYQSDLAGGFDQGAAYAFVLSGTWLEFQKFIASDAESSDLLGSSVALDGDTAVVGAEMDDLASGFPGSINGQGSVYEFEVCPAPVNYCTAGTSASGCQALISSSGIPSGTSSSGFLLTATGAEGAKDGLFFFGANGRQANAWGNGSSFQCVVPPVFRGGLLLGTGTAGQCDGSFSQDMNALWCPTCPKPLKNPGIGATVQAQLWHRDPLSTSSQTTTLSGALEFCVGP